MVKKTVTSAIPVELWEKMQKSGESISACIASACAEKFDAANHRSASVEDICEFLEATYTNVVDRQTLGSRIALRIRAEFGEKTDG